MSNNLQSIRNRIYANLQQKEKTLDGRTYGALLRKYYNVSGSKPKLLKFESSLGDFSNKTVTVTQLKENIKEEKTHVQDARKQLNTLLHSDKKVVSCNYIIYKPKPATYQGTQSIEFQDEQYVPLTSNFYLSKISSFPQVLFKKLKSEDFQVIRADEIFEAEYDAISQMEGGKELIMSAYLLSKSLDNLILIQNSLTIDNTADEPVNIVNEYAFDDGVACPFINVKEYIANDFDDVQTSLEYNNKYVTNNFRKRSCWLSLILETFKEPIEKFSKKKHKKPIEMTYEFVHSIIAPEKELRESGNGYNYQEIVKFFKLFKISIYLFDIHLNVKEYYNPSSRNNNIGSAVIYVMQHDKHIYRLNHNLKRLEQKLEFHIDRLQQICKVPNNKYFLKKKDEEIKSILIQNADDVFEIMANNDLVGEFHLLYNKYDCFDLWMEFYKKGIKPSVLMTKEQVSFDFLRLNTKKKQIIIQSNCEEGVAESLIFATQKEFEHYTERKNWASNNLLTTNYLSNYSNNVKEMLITYMPSALIGGFIETDELNTIQLDYNKYYTSILRDMPCVPIINSFDNFQNYNNEVIEDMNVYFVEKLTTDNCYPFNKFNICFGKNIIGVKNITILAQLKISQTKESCSKQVIENLYKDEDLTETMKKNIINHIIGKYNKSSNTKIFTSITTNRDEALRTKKDYGGKIIPIEIENEDTDEDTIEKKKLFANYIKNEIDLNQGFRLISLYVYDTANKQLLQLKESIEKYGLEVYKCNTDCVYIENDSEKLNIFINDNKDLFEFNHKGDFEAIGKIKQENKLVRNCTLMKKKFVTNLYDIINPLTTVANTRQIKLQNEWDNKQISYEIDCFDKLIITADIAGAGKSYAFKYHCQNKNEINSTLFVTPYNALAMEFKKEGFQSITLDKLLGNLYDGKETIENKSKFDVSEYKRIVFDEIFLHNIHNLEQLKSFMIGNPSIKFNATGDPNQLQPVKQELNTKDAKQYYLDAIFSMFPNNINLQENKRCKTKEDQIKIKQMTSEIRDAKSKSGCIQVLKKYGIKFVTDKNNITTSKNVVALNKTCDLVNEIMYKKLHPKSKYFVGQQLICRKSMKIAKFRTYVNYTYTVKEIKDNSFILNDGDDDIEIFADLIYKHFKLPYARTCHSYQGMSENEPITIFDINHFMVDIPWIYTAITRTTQLDNIHIYIGDMDDGTKLLREQIENMIIGHINADADAGRDVVGKFITANWVMNQLKETKICKYCKKDFDVSSLECFSVDRIDNNLAHTQMNCQIICRHCNVSKK